MKVKRKPVGTNSKATHVRVGQRGKERIEACFKVAGLKSRQQMLDNWIRSMSIDMGVEPGLERRWRTAGKRKAKGKARRDGSERCRSN